MRTRKIEDIFFIEMPVLSARIPADHCFIVAVRYFRITEDPMICQLMQILNNFRCRLEIHIGCFHADDVFTQLVYPYSFRHIIR